MTLTRRSLLATSAAVAAAATAAIPAQAAEPTALWPEFRRNPYNHPQIPFVGTAGYSFGSRTRPHHAVRADVTDFGALPDGSADAAPAINAAIEYVGAKGGGAVQVPPGTYRIDDVIRIGYDNVVLRGAGSSHTTFYATHSLEEAIGINRSRYGNSPNSAWSWSGGMVWICPKERYEALTTAIKAHDWPFEGWTGNDADEAKTLTEVTAPAARGDFTLDVADARHLHPGDRVMLQLDDDADHTLLAAMSGDVPGTADYVWSDKTKLLSYAPFNWPVRIAKVRHNRITLAQPLPLPVRAAWNPRISNVPHLIANSGVEGITIELIKTIRPAHLQDKGYNALAIQCAWDCWADDIHAVNADNGFLYVSAKNCTMSRTRNSGRGSHHSYACREQSHDNVFEDFTLDAFTEPPTPGSGHHGINVEGLSCGNVWSRGHMDAGTFDSHRGLPFGNVRTEITVFNDGAHGGSADAGPLYGARFTHWNVTVTNGRAGCIKIDDIAPCSATVAISTVSPFGQIDKPDFKGALNSRLELYGTPEAAVPRNLYEAQRALCH
ncbi:glycosyl hydrolase family 28-related protein [Streptomyces sp. NBC_01465]|uniref:glycosyl hydrolase family 28-related protein n=1 Tax=Streptomyces sp. NBC_01465 TaxID=2903878 RepID=UPI002E310E29|nr:glycosyl hydrolase family 28-related protein [Streptomyces sp. NBC_01465]